MASISAKIILDSVSVETGVRLTTFEVNVHRFLVAQINTHRMFSRNSSSTRAININSAVDRLLQNEPAKPVFYGKEKAGMKADESISDKKIKLVDMVIKAGMYLNIGLVKCLSSLGLHKQIAGRYLEPFLMTKMVITATEFENFFQLRTHKAAQPEIKELADLMKAEYEKSVPKILVEGEYHAPYVGHITREMLKETDMTKDELLKISASCIAQVSFRNLDTSIEKAIRLTNILLASRPPHASPFESIAMVVKVPTNYPVPSNMVMKPEYPMTHVDVNGDYWSGNLKGWAQYRKILTKETKVDLISGAVV